MEKLDCTGVILAGGCNSTGLGTKNEVSNGGPHGVLTRIHTLFSKIFKEVVFVADNPALYLDIDAMVVTHINPCQSPLSGLHAGLFHASFDWSCVTACDSPVASQKIILHYWEQRVPGKQVIIPEARQEVESFVGLYHKSCIPRIETGLKKKQAALLKIFKAERVKRISLKTLGALDL